MMERRYFTTRKEHALHVIAVWCNSVVTDIKTVGGLAATVFFHEYHAKLLAVY